MYLVMNICDCDSCKKLRKDNRAFEAKIIRLGRRYKIPNNRLMRPLAGFLNTKTGKIEYARVPYELD
jgi:hypothetical protein